MSQTLPAELTWSSTDDDAVRYLRALAADAVQKVGNGHPGTAMALAPAAYLLFQRVMRHDPSDPSWIGRDRFVLSGGHSSLTLYSQLFLSGYGLTLDDLQAFRTAGSRTPGHPEYGHTTGVEATTGPLGQGIAMAVGMAMASRFEHGLFDHDTALGASPFDHRVWVVCGDGDLEEGVSSEASSLAGTQQLSNLCVIWDDNRISIEGDTAIAFTEDVTARYAAYGWAVHSVDMLPDGSIDVHALYQAVRAAETADRPTFIRMRSIIAWPAPQARNTAKAHGSALGADEIAATKVALGLDPGVDFAFDPVVLAEVRSALQTKAARDKDAWQQAFDGWRAEYPEQAALLDRLRAAELPAGFDEVFPTYEPGSSIAMRAASGKAINAVAAIIHTMIVGIDT